jgi:hypothetical protein
MTLPMYPVPVQAGRSLVLVCQSDVCALWFFCGVVHKKPRKEATLVVSFQTDSDEDR